MIHGYIERLTQTAAADAFVYRSTPFTGVEAYYCGCGGALEHQDGAAAPGYLEAVLCLAGRLQVQFGDDHTEAAGPGELLLLTDGARVTGSTFIYDPVSFVAVVAEQRITEAGKMTLPPFDSDEDRERLQALLKAHSGYLVLRDPDWSNAVLAALRCLPPERYGAYVALRLLERLCVLCREPLGQGDAAQGYYYDSYQRQAVRKVHDYMLENLDQPSTIRMLAQRFQMSPTYLKESFRRIYGQPIHTYLQQYRMQRAAHLLCTTEESVLSIAERVGYSGTSRFNSAFKQTYHVTPMQYRKLHSGKMSKTGE